MILQQILRKYGLKVWTGFVWFKIRSGNEPLGSIKKKGIFDQLSDDQLFKKDLGQWIWFIS
jgi:hypothetical protein